ncbi:MAG: hypothetical protein GY938_25710 [Ketobacter sp.]|nr:hypothetical protein [Ketobacter sp.]
MSSKRESVTITAPLDLVKLLRRLDAASDGRLLLIVTKESGVLKDWTLSEVGKVERPRK